MMINKTLISLIMHCNVHAVPPKWNALPPHRNLSKL